MGVTFILTVAAGSGVYLFARIHSHLGVRRPVHSVQESSVVVIERWLIGTSLVGLSVPCPGGRHIQPDLDKETSTPAVRNLDSF